MNDRGRVARASVLTVFIFALGLFSAGSALTAQGISSEPKEGPDAVRERLMADVIAAQGDGELERKERSVNQLLSVEEELLEKSRAR